MKKYILAAMFSLALLASPVFTQAAGLTQDQINSIISLIQSFGADSTTIANVKDALYGDSSGGGDPQPWCHTFTKDLTVGSNNDDVSSLRTVLRKEGLLTQMADAPFDENLAADVVQFQAKYGIRQTGYVGPITRAKLNKLYGCSNPVPPSTFSASPTSGGAPLAVMFYSNTQGGTVNFGDGTPSTSMECDTASTANSSSVSSACLRTFTRHTYTAPGIYTATLQALPQCAVYAGQNDSSNCKPVTIGKITITVTDETTQPPINVLSPNGGEQWQKGSTQNITWNPAGAGMIDISLVSYRPPCTGIGISCTALYSVEYAIATQTANDGVFEWGVGKSLDGKEIPEGKYTIRVSRSIGAYEVRDESDAPFSIVAPPPVSTPVTLSFVTPASGPVGTSVRLDGCGSDSSSGFILVYAGPKSGTASIPVETLGAASGCGYMTFTVPSDFPTGTYTLSVKNNQTGAMSTNSKAFTVTASDGGTGSTVACTASFSPNPVKTGDITALNFQSGTNDTLFQYSCNHQFTKEDGTAMLSYGSLPLGGSWRIKAPGPLDCTLTSWNPNVTGSGSTCHAILKTISETTTTTVTVPAGACTTSFSPSAANINDVITWNFQAGVGDTTFQYSCNHAFTKEDGTTSLSYGPLPSSGSWRIKVPGYGFDCTLSSYNPSVTGSGSTCRATLKASSAMSTYSNPGLASALGAFSGATNSVSQSTDNFNYVWTRDLQIGSPYQGDVIALQQALTREGVYAGEITGGFYNQTYAAVKSFQQKYGIEATGFVGPLTRAELNTLFAR